MSKIAFKNIMLFLWLSDFNILSNLKNHGLKIGISLFYASGVFPVVLLGQSMFELLLSSSTGKKTGIVTSKLSQRQELSSESKRPTAAEKFVKREVYLI